MKVAIGAGGVAAVGLTSADFEAKEFSVAGLQQFRFKQPNQHLFIHTQGKLGVPCGSTTSLSTFVEKALPLALLNQRYSATLFNQRLSHQAHTLTSNSTHILAADVA